METFVHASSSTLGAKIGGENPYLSFERPDLMTEHESHLEELHEKITNSLSQSKYKKELRGIMNGAKYGNQIIQTAPWKHMKGVKLPKRRRNLWQLLLLVGEFADGFLLFLTHSFRLVLRDYGMILA